MYKISSKNLKEAANLLKNTANIIAVPTETVFGLAVKYNSEEGTDNLIKLKNREIGSGKQFALALSDPSDIKRFAIVTAFAEKIIKSYLPGELTIILEKNPAFNNYYFNNFKTIGIRIPADPYLNRLLKLSGPVLLTSANLKGEPPALSVEEVEKTLKINAVIDKPPGNNPPTTIIKITNKIEILRQGALVVVK